MSVNGTLEPVQTLTGTASASPYIPERMAHKLTFTGAVEAEYDGSAGVEVEIPTGGGEVTPDDVAAAVEAYMAEHPVEESDPTVPEWAKAETKPTYTAEEVGALPDTTEIPTVPTNVSAFNNDAGYLTEHQDLSEYAKTEDIPSVPSALPNPYKLTFTGAVSAEYDGSAAVSVEIPSGGGGSEWTLLADITTEEDVASITVDVPEGCRELFVKGCGYYVPDGSGYAFLKINDTSPSRNVGAIAETNGVWFFNNNKRTMCCHVQRAGNNLVSNFNSQTFNPPVPGVVRGMQGTSAIGLFEDFGEDSAIETVTLTAQAQFLAGFRFTVWRK